MINSEHEEKKITEQDYFRYDQCQYDSCTACCDYIRAICRRITEIKREERNDKSSLSQ